MRRNSATGSSVRCRRLPTRRAGKVKSRGSGEWPDSLAAFAGSERPTHGEMRVRLMVRGTNSAGRATRPRGPVARARSDGHEELDVRNDLSVLHLDEIHQLRR